MNDKTLAKRGDVAAIQTFTPQNLSEAMTFAKLLAESDLVPKDYKGKPGNCLVAMQMGAELGVAPMQAIQNIAVVNGRPAVYGDLLLALVQRSPSYESHQELFDEKTMTATCVMKRKGDPEPHLSSFSKADAEKAKLWGKEGPWTNYPKRMLQLRARSFCARDTFADALRGIAMAEEVADYAEFNATAERVAPAMPRELSAAPEPTVPPAEPETQGPQLPPDIVHLVAAKPGRNGERKDGSKYQAYDLEWADKDGKPCKEETFSKTVFAKAQEAIAEKKLVKLTIETRSTGQRHITSIEAP
jgi:hypothetical protein